MLSVCWVFILHRASLGGSSTGGDGSLSDGMWHFLAAVTLVEFYFTVNRTRYYLAYLKGWWNNTLSDNIIDHMSTLGLVASGIATQGASEEHLSVRVVVLLITRTARRGKGDRVHA